MTMIIRKEPRQAKISNFWLKLIIKKNIARFNITVYDTDMKLLMKICKTTSHANNDVKSLPPIEGSALLACNAKMRHCIKRMSLVLC